MSSALDQICNNPNPGNIFDACAMVGFDGYAGLKAGQMVQKTQLNAKILALEEEYTLLQEETWANKESVSSTVFKAKMDKVLDLAAEAEKLKAKAGSIHSLWCLWMIKCKNE